MKAVCSKRVLGGLAWAALLVGCAVSAHASTLNATGDAQNLWILRPKETGQHFLVMHRKLADQPESRLSVATSLSGTLLPGGAIAGDGFLWLFYADHSVQALRVVEDAVGRRGYTDIMLPALPRPVTVRSLAVTRAGAWALVRIEDPRVLEVIDNPPGAEPTWREKQRDRTKTKVNFDAEKTAPPAPVEKDPAAPKGPAVDQPTAAKDKAKQPSAEPTVKADRLLHLATSEWVKVDLPNDWSPDTPAWLVTLSYDMERPLLVSGPPSEKLIRWHRWEHPGGDDKKPHEWVATQQTLDDPVRMQPVAVQQQLVVVQRKNTPGKIELGFVKVRPERVSDMGSVSLADGGGAWSITPYGERLALIASDKSGALAMNRIDLRGVTDANPTPLKVEPPPLGPVADMLVYVIVLAVATPILILMWKRESGPLLVQLPRTLRIGEFGPRALAAILDLLPGMFASMLITGVSLDRINEFWPGATGDWEKMIPGAIVIGIFFVHTFFTELFTARTLGKAMVGLRVTGLRGQPPDLWQVLARNVFKIVDLIMIPLLVFAIISPNRQRLGDVVARTIVVRRARSDENAPPGPRRGGPRDEEEEKSDEEELLDPRPRRKD